MGITHLEEHTGFTKKLRISATAPTDPAPEAGDMYIDNSTGAEALGVYNGSGWTYVSLST